MYEFNLNGTNVKMKPFCVKDMETFERIVQSRIMKNAYSMRDSGEFSPEQSEEIVQAALNKCFEVDFDSNESLSYLASRKGVVDAGKLCLLDADSQPMAKEFITDLFSRNWKATSKFFEAWKIVNPTSDEKEETQENPTEAE